jgi:hypothetical protein
MCSNRYIPFHQPSGIRVRSIGLVEFYSSSLSRKKLSPILTVQTKDWQTR